MKNLKICPETEIKLLLRADLIADSSNVCMRTGQKVYILKHGLTLYNQTAKGLLPTVIEGFFLVSDRGEINQISPDKELCWVVTAEQFVDEMQSSWRETEQ